MKTIKKSELLTAMKNVLKEYKNNKHKANLDTCTLCKLYYKGEDVEHIEHDCCFCPMFVFQSEGADWYPCMNRKCEPMDCCDGDEMSVELKRVIEFYKETIKIVDKMSVKELNAENAFKFIVKLDDKIYWKY